MTIKRSNKGISVLMLPFLVPLLSSCGTAPTKAPGIDVDVVEVSPNDPQPAGACVDYAINGANDCSDFLSACGTGGNSHAHSVSDSGFPASTRYTCHEGSEHRPGD